MQMLKLDTKKKNFLPVVLVKNFKQTSSSIRNAKSAGADGVFLVSNGTMETKELIMILQVNKVLFPDFWMGVNIVGVDARDVFFSLSLHIDNLPDGILIEDTYCGVKGKTYSAESIASEWMKYKEYRENTLYFGGVGFKDSSKPFDIIEATENAQNTMDIVTTSGAKTGKAAEVEKIKAMYESSKKPIALASGISNENIKDYLPYVDYFLVESSIEHNGIICEDRTRKLAETIHEWCPKKKTA